jgi:hypothetical protein
VPTVVNFQLLHHAFDHMHDVYYVAWSECLVDHPSQCSKCYLWVVSEGHWHGHNLVEHSEIPHHLPLKDTNQSVQLKGDCEMVCEDERISAKVATCCTNLKRTRFLPDETPSMSETFLALYAIPLSTQVQQGWVKRLLPNGVCY